MESPQGRKSGLPPVVDEDTEILILGTLPSDKSIAAEQYYANPGNDFWKLVGAALDNSLDDLSYEDKLALLKACRIGLWDAYHSCVCPGSMDGNITEQVRNDFNILKSLAPNIRLICFNGKGAAEAEEPLHELGFKTVLLPSSSPANRRDQDGRMIHWMRALRPTGTDFNRKYGLEPEPVLDDADVLSPDGLSSLFTRVDTGLIPSLSDVQSVLGKILLIPQVPDSVKRTFQIAKRLYLFGRFEYGFYTASQHYAFLATEAAIFSRWTASLPNPVNVKGKNFSQQMFSPSHSQLAELFYAKDGRSLSVDGLPFPNSLTKVLKTLREGSVIDERTEKWLTAVIGLRNDLSHHESTTMLPPSTASLSTAAQLINTLFDSLPCTS
jgi:hypoxanthine-DNA glycosylase